MYIVGLYVYGYTLIPCMVFDFWVLLGCGFYEVGKHGETSRENGEGERDSVCRIKRTVGVGSRFGGKRINKKRIIL